MSCPFGYGAAAEKVASGGACTPTSRHSDTRPAFSVLGFDTTPGGKFTNEEEKREKTLCNYTDYIQTEALLRLQDGESIMKPEKKGMMHHEELLFIVTHQSIELWFKVLLKDLEKSRGLLESGYVGGSAEQGIVNWRDLALVGQYLRRATMIWHHASNAFAVLQTMHPADFLEFRDYLVPASGFQSFQFRKIEILMGLDEQVREMCNNSHVFNALLPSQKVACEHSIKQEASMRATIEEVLLNVAVPDNFMSEFYRCTEELHVMRQKGLAGVDDATALELAKEAVQGIREVVERPDTNKDMFPDIDQSREKKVMEAALYVSSYRQEHPCFAVLSEILDELVALEEGLLLFRSRHLHNVERVIGRRLGTGGSSGAEYLAKTREYRIFTILWSLRKVFIRSSILPPLSALHGGVPTNDIDLFRMPVSPQPASRKYHSDPFRVATPTTGNLANGHTNGHANGK